MEVKMKSAPLDTLVMGSVFLYLGYQLEVHAGLLTKAYQWIVGVFSNDYTQSIVEVVKETSSWLG